MGKQARNSKKMMEKIEKRKDRKLGIKDDVKADKTEKGVYPYAEGWK